MFLIYVCKSMYKAVKIKELQVLQIKSIIATFIKFSNCKYVKLSVSLHQ